jgi:hypothetical protein
MEASMIKKRLWTGFLLCALVIPPLPAAMVSFLVIESGLPEESGASSWSSLWESGLLDVFFEAGYVVSNAPIKRLAVHPRQTLPDEVKDELDDAEAGGADYFILALLDYSPPAEHEIPRPRHISLRVFRINPRRFIHEQQYVDPAALNMADEFTRIKQSVRGLVPHLADK